MILFSFSNFPFRFEGSPKNISLIPNECYQSIDENGELYPFDKCVDEEVIFVCPTVVSKEWVDRSVMLFQL